MRAFLDDRVIDVPDGGGGASGSVAAAIAAARAEAHARGRVIIDVLVDGERLDEEALDAPNIKPAGDIEFKCFSADPRQLVAESFIDVSRALDEARSAQREAAEALQTGKLETAFEQLAGVLQVWDAVHRVTDQGPALLGVPLASLDPAAGAVERDLATLSSTLQQVKDAVGTQDWSTLADLLTHELDTAADQWTRLLVTFSEHAKRSASSSTGGGV